MRLLVFDPALCSGCRVCEATCSQTWFKVQDELKSAIRVLELTGESSGFAADVCNQCGQCIDVCPSLALTRDRQGIVRINKELCVGCLSCVGFCPTLSMRTHPDHTIPFKCVACGQCAKKCPERALAVVERPDAPLTVTEQRMEVRA